MTDRKVIWLDADGVLLDYTRPFLAFAGLEQKVQYETLFDYDLTKLFDSPDLCHGTMLQFAMSEYFKNLPSIANPQLLVALKNVGYELRVITKLPAPPRSRINRVLNLSAYFGPIFDEIVFTGSHECKVDYLVQRRKQEDADYIVVEDNPDFLFKAEKYSFEFETFAVAHPYNQIVHNSLITTHLVANFDEAAIALLHRKV